MAALIFFVLSEFTFPKSDNYFATLATMTRLSQFLISPDDLEQKSKIGRGGFGTVYMGEYKPTGATVVIKYLIPSPDAAAATTLIRELEILATLKHPATLSLTGFCLKQTEGASVPNQGIIVMPFMERGGLDNVCNNKIDYPEWTPTRQSQCVFGIVAGMAYLHSHGILHRDLKPENVVLDGNFNPHIADYGLSRHINTEMTRVGTLEYTAPEVFWQAHEHMRARYSGAVDVYSFGVLLVTLFDSTPYGSVIGDWEEFARQVHDGLRPSRPKAMPDFYWQLANQCWDPSPHKRPTFAQLVTFLQSNREKYAFRGTDMNQLIRYEKRVLEGVELVDRTYFTFDVMKFIERFNVEEEDFADID